MPIMNIAVVLVILGLAYFWAGQGLFSALIHFLCVLVAGAVALAVWEPLTYGLLLGLREDIAWSVGLLAPFVITVGLLRVLTNKYIPTNLDFSDTANFVGGAVFGGGGGLLTAGFLVISIGYLPVAPDFLGYKAVDWDRTTGAVDARNGSRLWIPADLITTKVYEQLSTGALSTATPLAHRLPNLHEQADLMRVTYEGKSRTTLKPDDVTLGGHYVLETDAPADLLTDSFIVSEDGSPVPQQVILPDGSPPPPGSRIEGFVITLGPGAKEKKGQVVLGPGQVRLLITTADGKAESLGPIAFIARSSGNTLQVNRYRFDGPEVYAASVGGAADATFAFEFAVPAGAATTDLMIKNVRVPTDSMPAPREIASTAERDDLVRTGEIIGVAAQSVGGAEVIGGGSSGPTQIATSGGFENRQKEIVASRSVGVTFNKQDRGNLELNSDNRIIDGRATLDKKHVGGSMPSQLRVDSFQAPEGTVLVKVDLSPQSRASLLGQVLDAAERVLPPTLVDTLGQQYQAVGYVYSDTSKIEIRFTPGQPIRGLTELPALSRSRSDQSLKLLFTPSAGVQIKSFGLGSKTKIVLDPPMQLRAR